MSFKKLKDKVSLDYPLTYYELEMAKSIYQFHNNSFPVLFNNYFKRAFTCHQHSTRFAANHNFFVLRVSASKGQSHFVGKNVEQYSFNNSIINIFHVKKRAEKMLTANYVKN